jgi:outer membrane protein assembly factor BamB
VRLRWLADLGAESLVASPPQSPARPSLVLASIPGAVYVFSVGTDGSLEKRLRLAADPSAAYGVAATDKGLALADRQGWVGLWMLSAGAKPAPRWRRDMGERVTSVGWDGGDRVFVATWKGRLLALAAADGRVLWSAELAGRAEAPALVEGSDVFVATKAKSLLRLDAATGAVRWKALLPGPALHPPAAFGQRPRLLLCGTWDGQLLAHDVLTGRVRWSVTLPAKLAGAAIVGPEFVAAVTADGAVHAYDPSGNMRWSAPSSADGAAALLLQAPAGATTRLLSISKALVALDPSTGARLSDYPQGALEDLRRRFADAMLEGLKTYSEGEKRAIQEREAFDIPAPLFGPARVFGSHLAFGTEDGWAYLFDAATLRPAARYRAGQPASNVRLAGGRVLAGAGEEIFALEPLTGKVLWKRVLGPDPGPITGEATLAAVAGGRVHALGASDGVPQWSLRGRFRSVASPFPAASPEGSFGIPWLVDDGEGNLRALLPPGRSAGEPLPAGGELLPPVAASERSWVAATREGKVFGVAWEETAPGGAAAAEGRLVKTWEVTYAERILDVRFMNERVLVRSEGGSLASLEGTFHQESWKMRLAREDRIQVIPHTGALLVLTVAEIRVHDGVSGELRFQQKVESPAVGADLRGTSLRWLDRSGAGHQVDVQAGLTPETTDLGLPLAEATPVPGGFLVTTAAGEVGFVDAQPASATGRAALVVQ